MKKLSLVLAALVLFMTLVPAGMAMARNPLRGAIDYNFVGHLGELDAEGRLLVWVGTFSGDINGEIKWWGEPDTPTTGQVFHFIERWEIRDGNGDLILAGDDTGTTTIRHQKNSIWRSNGIVTDANGDFAVWNGRNVHLGGNINWQVIETPDGPITLPKSGSGTFRIN